MNTNSFQIESENRKAAYDLLVFGMGPLPWYKTVYDEKFRSSMVDLNFWPQKYGVRPRQFNGGDIFYSNKYTRPNLKHEAERSKHYMCSKKEGTKTAQQGLPSPAGGAMNQKIHTIHTPVVKADG